ncbi:MAG: hypothetical protein MI924_20760 [Chloroflexales bacterium]|nr:hypothetical protein [Chloroflexales bacterium]
MAIYPISAHFSPAIRRLSLSKATLVESDADLLYQRALQPGNPAPELVEGAPHKRSCAA